MNAGGHILSVVVTGALDGLPAAATNRPGLLAELATRVTERLVGPPRAGPP